MHNVRVANKTYAQWCPVARALDIIGERWTLLIIRDLGFGLRRFTELQNELVGISPSLLSSRLRLLTESGVIERMDAQYRLTERGSDLLGVVNEIGRWGIGLAGSRNGERVSSHYPRSTIGYMVRTELLDDSAFVAELHLDDHVHTLRIADRSVAERPSHRVVVEDGAPAASDVRLRGTMDGLVRYRQRGLPQGQSFPGTELSVEGSPELIAGIGRIFSPE